MTRELKKLNKDELDKLAEYQNIIDGKKKKLSEINGGEKDFYIVKDSKFKEFDVSTEWNLSNDKFQDILSSMAEGCNQPYLRIEHNIKIKNTVIHRHNHNSTHGARSVIYLEKLFELGGQLTKTSSLSIQEKNAMRLAAFLYRAGRIDETGFRDDIKKRERCGQVFRLYADQFSQTEDWKKAVDMVQIIIAKEFRQDYKFPENINLKDYDKEKYDFIGNLLNISHELDLRRIWPDKDDGAKSSLKRVLSDKSPENIKQHLDLLTSYADKVINSTGIILTPHKKEYTEKFLSCTQDLKECFSILASEAVRKAEEEKAARKAEEEKAAKKAEEERLALEAAEAAKKAEEAPEAPEAAEAAKKAEEQRLAAEAAEAAKKEEEKAPEASEAAEAARSSISETKTVVEDKRAFLITKQEKAYQEVKKDPTKLEEYLNPKSYVGWGAKIKRSSEGVYEIINVTEDGFAAAIGLKVGQEIIINTEELKKDGDVDLMTTLAYNLRNGDLTGVTTIGARDISEQSNRKKISDLYKKNQRIFNKESLGYKLDQFESPVVIDQLEEVKHAEIEGKTRADGRGVDQTKKALIPNNGMGLKCGYFAMAAGILQLDERKKKEILNKIKFKQEGLTGDINKDQYLVGDELQQYVELNKDAIINRPLQEFFTGGINNNEIQKVLEDLAETTNIFADRMLLICQHLGVNVFLNGKAYGQVHSSDVPNIRISNPSGSHYEAEDITTPSPSPTEPGSKSAAKTR